MPRIDAQATASAWVKFGETKHLQEETATANGDFRPSTAQLAMPLDTLTSALTLSTEKLVTSKKTVLMRLPDAVVKYENIFQAKQQRVTALQKMVEMGHRSPVGRPFRPLEGEESFVAQHDEIVDMVEFAKKEARKDPLADSNAPVPLVANKACKGEITRYGQKHYVFDLSLASVVREGKQNDQFKVTFELEALSGDPDLYIGAESLPTTVDFAWASAGVGEDSITVLPSDPRYVMGKYFILVYSPAADSTFALTARPKKFVDEIPPEIMSQAKKEVYNRIKTHLANSDRRRHLSKIGTNNWGEIMRKVNAEEEEERERHFNDNNNVFLTSGNFGGNSRGGGGGGSVSSFGGGGVASLSPTSVNSASGLRYSPAHKSHGGRPPPLLDSSSSNSPHSSRNSPIPTVSLTTELISPARWSSPMNGRGGVGVSVLSGASSPHFVRLSSGSSPSGRGGGGGYFSNLLVGSGSPEEEGAGELEVIIGEERERKAEINTIINSNNNIVANGVVTRAKNSKKTTKHMINFPPSGVVMGSLADLVLKGGLDFSQFLFEVNATGNEQEAKEGEIDTQQLDQQSRNTSPTRQYHHLPPPIRTPASPSIMNSASKSGFVATMNIPSPARGMMMVKTPIRGASSPTAAFFVGLGGEERKGESSSSRSPSPSRRMSVVAMEKMMMGTSSSFNSKTGSGENNSEAAEGVIVEISNQESKKRLLHYQSAQPAPIKLLSSPMAFSTTTAGGAGGRSDGAMNSPPPPYLPSPSGPTQFARQKQRLQPLVNSPQPSIDVAIISSSSPAPHQRLKPIGSKKSAGGQKKATTTTNSRSPSPNKSSPSASPRRRERRKSHSSSRSDDIEGRREEDYDDDDDEEDEKLSARRSRSSSPSPSRPTSGARRAKQRTPISSSPSKNSHHHPSHFHLNSNGSNKSKRKKRAIQEEEEELHTTTFDQTLSWRYAPVNLKNRMEEVVALNEHALHHHEHH